MTFYIHSINLIIYAFQNGELSANSLLYMSSSNEIYAQEKKMLPTAECFRMIQQRKQIIGS